MEGATDPSPARADVSRAPLERATGEGESPVGDGVCKRVTDDREYRRPRGMRREAGSTTTQG